MTNELITKSLLVANHVSESIIHRIREATLLTENINKKVSVSYHRTGTEIGLIIKDEGQGFNWKNYMEYKGNGNEVSCSVNVQD